MNFPLDIIISRFSFFSHFFQQLQTTPTPPQPTPTVPAQMQGIYGAGNQYNAANFQAQGNKKVKEKTVLHEETKLWKKGKKEEKKIINRLLEQRKKKNKKRN